MREHRQIQNKSVWTNYIKDHMSNAVVVEGVGQTIYQTNDGETIAVWQSFGLGHIYEAREKQR